MKLLCSVAALMFLVPQQKNANADLKYEEKAGVSVQKPPKNDEWDFKDKGGFWNHCKIVVTHKVDELAIEICQNPPPTQGAVDIKKQAESDFTALSGTAGITEAKRISVTNQKLPGNGAGGVQASCMEATFKRGDKLVEYREWVFVGKENQCTYTIVLRGDEGMYKKHQKVADYILSSIKTWKLPK